MNRSLAFCTAVAAAATLSVDSASAQSLRDRLKRRLEDKVDQVVHCALDDTACIQRAQAEGKKVETTPATKPAETAHESAAAAAPAAAAPGEGVNALKPGEGAWLNYDFTPGTRPLFVDDFTRDTVGDFPRRLEFGDGNMEIAEWQGKRFLRATSRPAKFSIKLPEQLPEQFTIEFDATPSYSSNWMMLKFSDKADTDVRFRHYSGKGQGGLFGPRNQTQGTTTASLAETDLYRARIMVDGRYAKVYMNDTRVANIPNAELGRSNIITFEMDGTPESPSLIGNITVMAGGRKLYDTLAEKGRVATQGIYFDTGSDRIRPESTPTLKEIATMLTEHPELKLTIEGHTDNVGAAAANQTLSEKRAAAVKQVLSGQFAVDAGRLESKGLGASAPAGSNDTPEGRQSNRRVELVKS
jgi:outer membrane protein OmpA-like peptidoglycan-associated protein